MPDHLTKEQRSSLMRKVRPKNSKIERIMFRGLRKHGIYFQRHYKRVPGTPDIAKPSLKKAVFIHSDFWHGWQFPRWSHKLSSNFWLDKISKNRKRDKRKTRQLRTMGWEVLIVWEHTLKNDLESSILKVCEFLGKKNGQILKHSIRK